jgi:hypothetical protein
VLCTNLQISNSSPRPLEGRKIDGFKKVQDGEQKEWKQIKNEEKIKEI